MSAHLIMDKKDIYEHLARIYLDTSSKREKRIKTHRLIFRNLLFISIIFIFVFGTVLFFSSSRNKSFDSEVALVLLAEATKINFNFNPAKKETYSFNLNKLNLSKFKALDFSVKKSNYQDSLSLRVEFTNTLKEKSEIYFKDISHKWQNYRVNLSEFGGISDWSRMLVLSFTLEEWNTKDKKGIVYIDNVRLLR